MQIENSDDVEWEHDEPPPRAQAPKQREEPVFTTRRFRLPYWIARLFGQAEKGRQRVVVLTNAEMAIVREYGYAGLGQAATSFAERGRFKEAFLCNLIGTKTDPGEAVFWRNCGFALYSMDESVWSQQIPHLHPTANAEKAIKYVEKALRLDRDDYLAWCLKGLCLAGIGYMRDDPSKIQEGLECLDQALVARPSHAEAARAKAHYEMVLTTMRATPS